MVGRTVLKGHTMDPIKVELRWTKETKNTHRYDAAPDSPVPCLYLPKSALQGRERPDAIMVTVEVTP